VAKPHLKIPKWKEAPSPSKIPKSGPVESILGLHPAWRLSLLELDKPFGWHELDAGQMRYVREKLSSFESMTWGEILGKQNHRVAVDSICNDAQRRLIEIKQDDIDELVSLRLSGAERIWGILDNVVKVLWWDPNHEICPSLLKHT
jgi:hypothetical protein